MDMWKAEKLNAPADFMKAQDDGASVCNPTPPLMTPAQFTGGPLARPTASQTAPTQTLPQSSLFRAPPPSKFTEEGFGWTEPAAVEAWRPVHHKNQSEKILHHHSDNRLAEDERSSSKPLLQEMERLREDKKIMRGEMERLEGRVELLRKQIKDQQNQINRQCIESDELHSELKSCKAELGMSQDQPSILKREYELQRQHLEKALQDSKQEMTRLQQKLETQNVMTGAAQEVALLRTQIQEVISERDELKNQLSVLNSSLLEQSECVQKLRTYIGSNITEKREEEELRRQIQHLEKEKEALSLSVQLLNVRVNAANDILAIQEKELGEQVQTDPLYSGSKAGHMLSVWRQKVFMLLVKLQTRDLELHMEKTQLHNMVSSLQQQVECLQSQNSVFQHQLEDKTAQLELQRVHARGVQQQLDSALQENAQLKECNKSTEGSLNDISETAHRVMSAVEMKAGQMEAAQSSVSQLNQRLAFAAKRLDTVHGLLLRKEALWRTKKATRSPEPALSERLVVLRQVQRQVEREKDQMKAVEKERTEHTHKRITHLQKQLKEKDKDCNLLLAVVQEQGLMNEYKILRRSAIRTTEALKQKHHPQSESSNPSTPESLLGALQALSAAVMGSSEEEDDEEVQAFTVTLTPSCADTHKA
ncbi:coiled-coil alpha-helical rod protein 1-like [Sinocyclocheilus grahami]|uniref:coiled-coil alpha-helical rod protein 1-like n=1 Tax=Sinocyclocheilus grahami TaxID=75366 RepID=UPI0007AC6848|nr:PREDICTED: coiled-coil alpha-helical rod protein 1-like [Sinocyclocheilus grahami]